MWTRHLCSSRRRKGDHVGVAVNHKLDIIHFTLNGKTVPNRSWSLEDLKPRALDGSTMADDSE